jgi:hypothetical protein
MSRLFVHFCCMTTVSIDSIASTLVNSIIQVKFFFLEFFFRHVVGKE